MPRRPVRARAPSRPPGPGLVKGPSEIPPGARRSVCRIGDCPAGRLPSGGCDSYQMAMTTEIRSILPKSRAARGAGEGGRAIAARASTAKPLLRTVGPPSPPQPPPAVRIELAPGIASGAPNMEIAREVELRFSADAATFKALASHDLLGGPGKLRWSLQQTVYFDTDAADLRRSGMTLRMRRARGRNVMGLKLRDSAFDCGKVEVRTPGEELRIELFPPTPRDLISHALNSGALQPRFFSQIRRATRRISYDGALIDVAFDEGEIVAGAVTTPVREIELELKSGSAASLYRLGLALIDAAPVRLGVLSKSDRGVSLASGRLAEPLRAPPPNFDASATLDSATGALLRQSLGHFLGNWAALDSANAAEAVHQVRVALRRLRSLLALLGRSFPSADIDNLRAEAKRIADAFGEARDWRVFSDLVEAGPARRLPNLAGFSVLIEEANARAEAGHRRAIEALAAPATARFVFTLQSYVSMRGWRNSVPEGQVRALGEPAIFYAALALHRAYRRLKKRAQDFEALTPEGRHRMRIALKQMRYAVDFFGHLFKPASAVRDYVHKAAALQDMLGEANDAAVASELVARIDVAADRRLAFVTGAVVGWCERGGLLDERKLRRAWRSLRKAERFWLGDLRSGAREEAGLADATIR